MSPLLKLIIWIVVGYYLWRMFFRRQTVMEKTMAEQVGLQTLGDMANQTNIAMQPSISFLGPFPLAAANLDPIYAQPMVDTNISFQPTIDGQNSGNIAMQPLSDYLFSNTAIDPLDNRVYGYGPMTGIP